LLSTILDSERLTLEGNTHALHRRLAILRTQASRQRGGIVGRTLRARVAQADSPANDVLSPWRGLSGTWP
jgi:hypothetical protein